MKSYEAMRDIRFLIGTFTSSISLVSSVTIIAMIIASQKKLSTPYRRIIFGVSASDVIQSLAIVTSPFSPPKGTDFASWAEGNIATCNLNGFLVTNGISLVPMYTTSLSIYYVCKLGLRMSDDNFYYKVERYLHFVIILYNLSLTTTALVLETYNPNELGTCYYAEFPTGCSLEDSPDNVNPCTRGIHKNIFIAIGGMAGPFFCLAVLIVMSMLLIHHARKKTQMHIGRAVAGSTDRAISDRPKGYVLSDARQDHETNVQYLSRLYMRENVVQALLYISSFLFVYTVPCIALILELMEMKELVRGDKIIPILLFTILPLGGFFNILIYCRPKVNALCRSEPELSWFHALVYVIQAGGEIPSTDRPRKCCCMSLQAQSTVENTASDYTKSMLARQNDLYHRYMQRKDLGGNARIPEESQVDSNLAFNGMSELFDDNNVAFRDEQDWKHVVGDSRNTRKPEEQEGGYDPDDEGLYEIMYGRSFDLNSMDMEMFELKDSGLSLSSMPQPSGVSHDVSLSTTDNRKK